jgi:chloramphenicol-sensitive protein RarD
MEANGDSPKGLALATAVYLLWGFLPLYMVHLSHVPPPEVIVHRVLWSVPLAAVALLAMGKGGALRVALRSPRMLGMAAVTAAIVSLNWGIYVWAVTSGHALEAALGYYINPLFSVFLGAVLLRERLAPAQWAAIALAALAVGVLTWDAGRLPMAALGLTLTWGAYAFLKKWLPMGPSEGFLLEVLILAPFALLYLGWLVARGESHFLAGDAATDWLLLGCGAVTAVPLLLYAHGAKLLRLSTIGLLQYIAPTLVALVAVAFLGESFGPARMVAFPMIWAALAIYTASFLRQARAAA